MTSSRSSVKRWPATDAVLDALRLWSAAEAARRPELGALGYFGSYARREAGFGSDLDLVAVVRASPAPFLERPLGWPTHALPVPADLLVYTADEWRKLHDEGGRFARTLAREAVWLLDRRRCVTRAETLRGSRAEAFAPGVPRPPRRGRATPY